MRHPTLHLTVSVHSEDYSNVSHEPPTIKPKKIEVVTDTGAQSCLWGLQNFLHCGFTEAALIPVKHHLFAANREEIPVVGAIVLRLSGATPEGATHSAAVMTYVSPSTNRFYLSRDAMVQLKVISYDFPRLGAALSNTAVEDHHQSCECPERMLPPPPPSSLPFDCCLENNERMKMVTRALL